MAETAVTEMVKAATAALETCSAAAAGAEESASVAEAAAGEAAEAEAVTEAAVLVVALAEVVRHTSFLRPLATHSNRLTHRATAQWPLTTTLSPTPVPPSCCLQITLPSRAPLEVLDAIASSGTTKVQYEITGGALIDSVVATATPTIYGWVATGNTTTVPNGTYALQSVATYSGGVSATSVAITVGVNNPPPSTTVVLPANNATVSGTSQGLDAIASSGTTKVQYEITGGVLTDSVIATATPTIYGWVATWNTTTVPNGTYALQSVATYSGGVSGARRGHHDNCEQTLHRAPQW